MIKFNDLKKCNDRFQLEFEKVFHDFLNSGWYILGNQLKDFETSFARYCGTSECIGVGNGLDAIVLILKAYKALGILKNGDEVIVPANTYIASILAISECNLVPVLVEPSIKTCNLDPNLVKKHLTDKTKVLLAVHLYGQLADMESLSILAKKHHLLIIEDAAQAHGAENMLGVKAGNLGDAAAFSFYPGKNLGAMGDGGAITTNNIKLSETIKKIRNYGAKEKYKSELKGVNSRLDELQASFLNIKLKKLDADNEFRRSVADIYLKNIKNPKLKLPYYNNTKNHVFHVFQILCKTRDNLQDYLKANGVETLIHYPIPPHKQQAYKEWNDKQLPITEEIHNSTLSIPVHPCMEISEVEKIIKILNKY